MVSAVVKSERHAWRNSLKHNISTLDDSRTHSFSSLYFFLDAFLLQESYDVDMSGFIVFTHASPVDFNTDDTTVWHQSKTLFRFLEGKQEVHH